MSLHPLPTFAAEITAEWLTEVLRGCGTLGDNSSVEGVETQPLGEGAGMMSDLARLSLTYTGDATDAPATLVAKLPAANETNREVAISYNIYEREVRYYAELDAVCGAHTPVIHLSAIDAEGNFTIVMEDVAAYHIGDQIVGASLEQSEVCIDALAKLHASFWDDVEGLDWIPHIANSQHASNMQALASSGWDSMLATFGAFVPESINAVRESYVDAIDGLQQRLVTAPITLCHGDFRMDNLFFGAQPDHHPLLIVDWQGPLRGRGMNDVAHLLCQSSQTEVRRGHERALLERYLEGLKAQGVTDCDFEEAWQDYRHAALYLWTYVAVVSGALDVSSERAFAWMSKMVARNAAAIEDLDCLSLL